MAPVATAIQAMRGEAKLLNHAREKLGKLAKKVGLDLRQTHVRKAALIPHQRYATPIS